MILMVGGTGAMAAPAFAERLDEAVMVGAGKADDDEAENGCCCCAITGGSHGSSLTDSLSKLILTCDHLAIDWRRLRRCDRPLFVSSSSDSFIASSVNSLLR